MPMPSPKSMRSLIAGLRASGKGSAATIVPTRMSTRSNSSNVRGSEAASSEVDIVVMRRRADQFHPLGQQRAEAGAALEAAIPARGLIMPLPVDAAEIVRHRDLRGGGKVGEAHRRAAQPVAVIEQVIGVIEMADRRLHRLA
ncbi:hypothetical protein WR25_10464 [Diploscapter pachys]|uniref:Uncharacterized protein n=1 Tax=Diploscapter pachys TaxID=2018661 RepID=A0A2A2K7D3_9BILA|nr:hypothetical protein WR25_10464 [Diploscapter pachys]